MQKLFNSAKLNVSYRATPTKMTKGICQHRY